MAQNKEETVELPGVWKTIAAGFELTTRYPWLLILPVLLDVFLWLGPRLSFGPLVQQLLTQLPMDTTLMDPRPMLEVISTRTNMFAYLSVILLGVPVLMTGLTPEQIPITAQLVSIDSWGSWFGLLFGLTLVGLLLAATYSTLIATTVVRNGDEAIRPSASGAGALLQWIGRTGFRFGALAILYIIILLIVLLPITLVAGFVALLSQLLATLVLLAAPVIVLWITLFLSLTPQGMILNQKGFFPSLADSVRLFQANLLPALSLLLVVIFTRQLLSWLLLSADDGSWFMLAGILGYAFVSTALSAAMLIFYRDRYRVLPDITATKPNLETVNL